MSTTPTESQRAMADVDKVAKAIFQADDMAAKPDFAWGDTTAVSYRAMAIAAIDAYGISDDLALAQRLVQTAVWMKSQYQDAGMVVARVFCDAKGIDADALEREVRSLT